MYRRCITIALLAALAAPLSLPAQHSDSLPPAGTIRGTVVDAATSLPLIGATVTLAPSTGSGAFPPAAGESAVSATRSAVTRAAGDYVFSDLSSGRYRLYVQRLGYEAAALDVEMRGAATSRVSVGLVVLPVKLRAVEVEAVSDAAANPRITADTEGVARVTAARQRQRAFLGTDVRELTTSDVAEAVTLGEADLFRALRRLPGVASYDDWSTELWVRGATWNETEVLFDGLPLVQPTHSSGTLAGVGADAVGAAFLHPGVRSAALAGDGAALVDLRSRPGGGNGRVRSSAELSSVGAHLGFDQRSRDGRYDWSVSARRSYDDLATRPAALLAGGRAGSSGVHYTEIAARADVDLARISHDRY